MKAAVFVKQENIIYDENYKYPKLRKDGIIIKVKTCAICGSDVEAYKHETIPPPVVLGHEFAGDIAEIGERVKGWNVGDRVTVRPHIACKKCYYCKNGFSNLCVNSGGIGFTQDGAFAEYVKIPLKYHDLIKIPSDISYNYAALVETYSIGLRAFKISKVKKENNIVIIGAGAMGLFVLLSAKQAGVEKIIVIEPNEYNREKAIELGADHAFKPEYFYEIRSITNNIGPDCIFECVGKPETYIQAINLVRKAGTVVLIGLNNAPFEFNFFPMMLKELTLKTVTSTTTEDMQEIVTILQKKKVNLDPFITKNVKLKEVQETIRWLGSPERKAVKVIVRATE